MSYIPIEKFEKLLTEYGRAFALANVVENSLDSLLKTKYNLYRSDVIISKFLNELMIGKKISIVEELKLIPKTLIKDLYKLNNLRVILAHGTTSEERLMKDVTKSTGKLFIEYKNKKEFVDDKFFNEIIDLSRSILDRLHEESIKGLV